MSGYQNSTKMLTSAQDLLTEWVLKERFVSRDNRDRMLFSLLFNFALLWFRLQQTTAARLKL